MIFQHAQCPVCNRKVSFFWNYFSMRFMNYTCTNCSTKIKWHPIMGLYAGIGGLIMFAVFFLIKDYVGSPYLALIIGFGYGQLVFMLLPKKVKIVGRRIN